MKKFSLFVLIFFSLILLVDGCKRSSPSKKLQNIDEIISVNPDSASKLLTKISSDTLNKPDQFLFKLLKIKVKDKAYILHTNDSLITDVLEFYSKHQSDPYYSEALYYGGRVYCDLGDYPTSLRYFQTALQYANDEDLKANILSQIGWILNSMRLYEEALTYINQVIKIERDKKDTLNLIHDLRLAGAINLHLKKYGEATKILKEALRLALPISESLSGTIEMYLAGIKYENSEIDSALILIRGVPEKISDTKNYTALNYASRIYLEAGKYDTALIYAKKLISSTGSLNRRGGYDIILNTNLREYLPLDTIMAYSKIYSELVQDFVNKNADENALIQNSVYNYTLQQSKRIKAENAKRILEKIIIISLSFALIVLLILLIFYIKSRRKILNLHNRIELLRNINRNLRSERYEIQNSQNTEQILNNSSHNTSKNTDEKRKKRWAKTISEQEKKMRKQLTEEYYFLAKNTKELPPLESAISKSRVYKELQSLKDGKIPISYNAEIWKDLDIMISKVNPLFKKNIEILIGKKLTGVNYQLVMLMKCRFRSAEIGRLCGRETNTISTRKTSLRKNLEIEDIKQDIFEKIIQLL